jgi:hypothetical protein
MVLTFQIANLVAISSFLCSLQKASEPAERQVTELVCAVPFQRSGIPDLIIIKKFEAKITRQVQVPYTSREFEPTGD